MFLYILNILNDGLMRNGHDNNLFPKEIIYDAECICGLGKISRRLEGKILNEKLNNTIKLFCKYNLTFRESVTILNKLLINKKNKWILEEFSMSDDNLKLDSSYLLLSTISSEITERVRMKNENIRFRYLAL